MHRNSNLSSSVTTAVSNDSLQKMSVLTFWPLTLTPQWVVFTLTTTNNKSGEGHALKSQR